MHFFHLNINPLIPKLLNTKEQNLGLLVSTEFPLGLAPKMARLTLAFLPSMMGLGSLQAFSAPSLLDIMTWEVQIWRQWKRREHLLVAPTNF